MAAPLSATIYPTPSSSTDEGALATSPPPPAALHELNAIVGRLSESQIHSSSGTWSKERIDRFFETIRSAKAPWEVLSLPTTFYDRAVTRGLDALLNSAPKKLMEPHYEVLFKGIRYICAKQTFGPRVHNLARSLLHYNPVGLFLNERLVLAVTAYATEEIKLAKTLIGPLTAEERYAKECSYTLDQFRATRDLLSSMIDLADIAWYRIEEGSIITLLKNFSDDVIERVRRVIEQHAAPFVERPTDYVPYPELSYIVPSFFFKAALITRDHELARRQWAILKPSIFLHSKMWVEMSDAVLLCAKSLHKVTPEDPIYFVDKRRESVYEVIPDKPIDTPAPSQDPYDTEVPTSFVSSQAPPLTKPPATSSYSHAPPQSESPITPVLSQAPPQPESPSTPVPAQHPSQAEPPGTLVRVRVPIQDLSFTEALDNLFPRVEQYFYAGDYHYCQIATNTIQKLAEDRRWKNGSEDTYDNIVVTWISYLLNDWINFAKKTPPLPDIEWAENPTEEHKADAKYHLDRILELHINWYEQPPVAQRIRSIESITKAKCYLIQGKKDKAAKKIANLLNKAGLQKQLPSEVNKTLIETLKRIHGRTSNK